MVDEDVGVACCRGAPLLSALMTHVEDQNGEWNKQNLGDEEGSADKKSSSGIVAVVKIIGGGGVDRHIDFCGIPLSRKRGANITNSSHSNYKIITTFLYVLKACIYICLE